jgi:hypothetical protein
MSAAVPLVRGCGALGGEGCGGCGRNGRLLRGVVLGAVATSARALYGARRYLQEREFDVMNFQGFTYGPDGRFVFHAAVDDQLSFTAEQGANFDIVTITEVTGTDHTHLLGGVSNVYPLGRYPVQTTAYGKQFQFVMGKGGGPEPVDPPSIGSVKVP